MDFEQFKSLMDTATSAALRGDVEGVKKVMDQMPTEMEKNMVGNLIETARINKSE